MMNLCFQYLVIDVWTLEIELDWSQIFQPLQDSSAQKFLFPKVFEYAFLACKHKCERHWHLIQKRIHTPQ